MLLSLVFNLLTYPGKWLLKLIIGKNRFTKVKDNKALFIVFGLAAFLWLGTTYLTVSSFIGANGNYEKGWLIFDVIFPIGCLILAIVERILPPVKEDKIVLKILDDNFQVFETEEMSDEQAICILRVIVGKKHYDYKFVESFREKCTVDEFIKNCKEKNYEGAEDYLEKLRSNQKFISFIDKEQKAKEEKTANKFAKKIDEMEAAPGQIKCPHCGKVQSESIRRCLKCGELIDKQFFADDKEEQ